MASRKRTLLKVIILGDSGYVRSRDETRNPPLREIFKRVGRQTALYEVTPLDFFQTRRCRSRRARR